MEENLLQEFITYLRLQGRHNDTLEQYRYSLYSFAEYLTKQSIFSFTAAKEKNITNFYHQIYKKGYASSTCWNKLYPVYSFYQWLKQQGILLYNPCPKPSRRVNNIIPNVVAREKNLRVIYTLLPRSTSLAEQRDYVMIDLAYSCGLRRCELHRMNVEDIYPDDKTIRVRGKRNKERLVPIGKNTLADLLHYVYYIRPQFLKKSTTKALFVSWKHGGKRMHRGSINRAFMRLRKKYNLDSTITPQALRCGCATEMLKNGAPLQDVSKILGHEKLETTQIYTKVIPSDLKKHHSKYHPRS